MLWDRSEEVKLYSKLQYIIIRPDRTPPSVHRDARILYLESLPGSTPDQLVGLDTIAVDRIILGATFNLPLRWLNIRDVREVVHIGGKIDLLLDDVCVDGNTSFM